MDLDEAFPRAVVLLISVSPRIDNQEKQVFGGFYKYSSEGDSRNQGPFVKYKMAGSLP